MTETAKKYYVSTEAGRRGPFDVGELKTLMITGDTPIWTIGQSDWLPARQRPELEGLLKELPPPPPQGARASQHAVIDYASPRAPLTGFAKAVVTYAVWVNTSYWLVKAVAMSLVAYSARNDWIYSDLMPRIAVALILPPLAPTLLMLFGGLQMRRNPSNGHLAIRVAALADIVLPLAMVLTSLFGRSAGSSSSSGLSARGVLVLMLIVATLAFELAILLFLRKPNRPAASL